MKSVKTLFAATAIAALLPLAYANADVIDPVGDILPSYNGPAGADGDVVSADVSFNGYKFILAATMAGAIGATPGMVYVWGFDKGGATVAPFAGIGEPNVKFNTNGIVVVNGTTGAVTIGGVLVATASITGNSFTAAFDSSSFPSNDGRAFGDYLWNLWPRFIAPAGTVAPTQPIPDFAPDNAMAKVRVPEPASLSLIGLGLAGLGVIRRRKARK